MANLAAEPSRDAHHDLIRSVWQADCEQLVLLSQASHGLGLVARWLSSRSTVPPLLWFPDYFCNGALDFVRAAGARLAFYPVARSLEPDWDRCREMARSGAPDIFALVHYFGRAAPLAQASSFCSEIGALLLEDCTQILHPTPSIGSRGDFVCFSPRKFFDTPDGGLLAIRGADLAGAFAQWLAKEPVAPTGSAA